MKNTREKLRIKKVYNRLGAMMAHTDRYAFDPAPRLARDTGLSYTTIYCLLRGIHSPSYYTAIKITEALERATKRRFDPREIMSISERFPIPVVCDFMKMGPCAYINAGPVVSVVEVPEKRSAVITEDFPL